MEGGSHTVGCWPRGGQDRQRGGTWQLGLNGDREAGLLEHRQSWRHGLLLELCPPAQASGFACGFVL